MCKYANADLETIPRGFNILRFCEERSDDDDVMSVIMKVSYEDKNNSNDGNFEVNLVSSGGLI